MLNNGVNSKNSFILKGSGFLLRVPRFIDRLSSYSNCAKNVPPVLINSFPKSGTHLLTQIVSALPDRRDYGNLIASMTSSFLFRERSVENTLKKIRSIIPGETVRGHLFYNFNYDEELTSRKAVHYFIFRDPRDVVISEAHYLRDINRWHRLHRNFCQTNGLDEAISLSIQGIQDNIIKYDYPNVKKRFERYFEWLKSENVFSIRFEDLISDKRKDTVRRIVDFYAERSCLDFNRDATVRLAIDNIQPEKSHTYRKGEIGGWHEQFSSINKALFKDIAGDLIIELGYETSLSRK